MARVSLTVICGRVARATEWSNVNREDTVMDLYYETQGTGKPVVLIHSGARDTDDLSHIARQFERVPAIRFARIEGADHMPTLTHPEEVSRLIIPFLGE